MKQAERPWHLPVPMRRFLRATRVRFGDFTGGDDRPPPVVARLLSGAGCMWWAGLCPARRAEPGFCGACSACGGGSSGFALAGRSLVGRRAVCAAGPGRRGVGGPPPWVVWFRGWGGGRPGVGGYAVRGRVVSSFRGLVGPCGGRLRSVLITVAAFLYRESAVSSDVCRLVGGCYGDLLPTLRWRRREQDVRADTQPRSPGGVLTWPDWSWDLSKTPLSVRESRSLT